MSKMTGFASMGKDKQREIASKGGKAAHAKGAAHQWDTESAREAGRKGGLATAASRSTMAVFAGTGTLDERSVTGEQS